MTSREIKTEIQKAIENVPENILEDVLNYLKQIQKHSKDKIESSAQLSKILKEDSELLERLAQ